MFFEIGRVTAFCGRSRPPYAGSATAAGVVAIDDGDGVGDGDGDGDGDDDDNDNGGA